AGIAVDVHSRTVGYGGRTAKIRATAGGAIARELLANSGRVVSLDALIERLWADCEDGGPLNAGGAINASVYHLRAAFTAVGAPAIISNIKGVGYVLDIRPVEAHRHAA